MSKMIVLLIILLSACGGAGATAPKAERISCTVAYRATVEQGIEQEETISFNEKDSEQSIAFADMVFHAVYSAGGADNERNLRIWVTDATDTVTQSALYQLPVNSGPQNQFIGGHGFTGLNYSYAPDSPAELQFWCEVE